MEYSNIRIGSLRQVVSYWEISLRGFYERTGIATSTFWGIEKDDPGVAMGNYFRGIA